MPALEKHVHCVSADEVRSADDEYSHLCVCDESLPVLRCDRLEIAPDGTTAA